MATNTGVFKELKELVKVQEAAKKELQKKGEAMLKDAFKTLFEKHPKILSFSWTQYTPGFNDGEPCEFNVCAYFKTQREESPEEGEIESQEDEDENYSDEGVFIAHDTTEKEENAIDKSMSELTGILGDMEDALECIFGNGVKIIVTPKKIKVEDYDCGF